MAENGDKSEELHGEGVDVFRPALANIIAGFIISVLLVAGGITVIATSARSAARYDWNIPTYDEHHMAWVWLALLWLVGAGLIVGGIALARYSRGLITHRVEIRLDGFVRYRRDGEDRVKWSMVRQIRETIIYQRPPVLKGPAKLLLPKLASSSFTIFVDGQEFDFDGNTVKTIKRFGRILRERADGNSILWEINEVHT